MKAATRQLFESGVLRRGWSITWAGGNIPICMVFKLCGRMRRPGIMMGIEKRVGLRPMSQDCQRFRGHVRNQSLEMRLLGMAVKVGGRGILETAIMDL